MQSPIVPKKQNAIRLNCRSFVLLKINKTMKAMIQAQTET